MHALAYNQPEESQRPEYFKPGFVADSHALRKILRSASTPPAAGRLLITISDETTGRQVEWRPIRRRKLKELADIQCESTLQNAKRWLLKHEHIQTRWNSVECCNEYALAEPLRLLLRPEERAARAKAPTPRKPRLQAVPTPSPLQPIAAPPCNQLQPFIKKQENHDQHHRPDPPETIPNPVSSDDVIITSGEVTAEVVMSDTTDTTNTDAATEKNNLVAQLLQQGVHPKVAMSDTTDTTNTDAATEKNNLVAQLLQQGVHHKVAIRLAHAQPADVIRKAIARLPKVPTNNPVGYLVAEISRGGYKDPDPTKPLRIIQQEISDQRQRERERDAEAKELSSARVATALEKFTQLPQEQQAGILQELEHQAQAEGFNRIPGWSESHPAYSGLLAEILASQPLSENPKPILSAHSAIPSCVSAHF